MAIGKGGKRVTANLSWRRISKCAAPPRSATRPAAAAADRRRLRLRIAIATVIGAAALLAGPGAAKAAPGPSTQDYFHPSNKYWILPAGDYSGNRQVTEHEITPADVAGMKVAWTFKIPDNSPIEAAPIVWQGTVYITSGHDDVYAVNAKSGKLEWQYQDHPKQLVGFQRNRGIALIDGNVYLADEAGHIVALDAKTGKKVWDKLEVQDPHNSFYTMQPVPYKGMLLLGVSDGDWGGRGSISAFDPKTGRRLWQWYTVPGPGEPGHDTWSGNSWKRGGATVWSGVAIDPKTNTLYIDAGNPQPDFYGLDRKGKNLYSDSMLALDIAGAHPKLKWYHQFIAHDTHDWDPAMPPVLFTGLVDGKKTRLVAAGDKAGNFWILDAQTGKLVHHLPVSYQLHHHTSPSLSGDYACPAAGGGVEYNGGAYDPTTNTFFVPSINECGHWVRKKTASYIPGQFYLGGAFPKLIGPAYGWFNAVNVNNGVLRWRKYFSLPANGGALVMSDGTDSVVFTGQLNGNFDAFDGKSGKLLWHHDTGASIIAPPSTFVANGRRYIVVASGNPGFLKVPELHESQIGPAVLTMFEAGPAAHAAAGGGGKQGDPTANGDARSK
jgi:alcohol dehydrogenase (cytochrome c)